MRTPAGPELTGPLRSGDRKPGAGTLGYRPESETDPRRALGNGVPRVCLKLARVTTRVIGLGALSDVSCISRSFIFRVEKTYNLIHIALRVAESKV